MRHARQGESAYSFSAGMEKKQRNKHCPNFTDQ